MDDINIINKTMGYLYNTAMFNFAEAIEARFCIAYGELRGK